MLTERLQSTMVRLLNQRYLDVRPVDAALDRLPPAPAGPPAPRRSYLLYVHVPFCERLCPYCSFNRFPFDEARARAYFKALRAEMRMLCGRGYDFKSMYVGGGTPTVLIDELTALIDEARALFGIEEVSCETNPNHLTPERLEVLEGRVQRLSVGVQSFDDGLLRQIGRHEAYGSGLQTLERLQAAARHFDTINADMIFNFPSQTEDQLVYDLACILESGVAQTTFYPLMASPSVARSLRQTVGQVSHAREHRYYQLVSAALCGEGPQPLFEFSSAWTFNAVSASTDNTMIDEYIVDYEEYPALGSGGFSYLDGSLYVNTFSVNEYIRLIGEGRMSVKGVVRFSRYDRMRYRLMMQLFGLRLDKRQWESDFGCSVASGVPVEYAFYRTAGAFARETADEIVLSTKGRYLLVALMRQFFVGVNGVRDRARASLPDAERLLFECLDDGQ